MTFNSYGNEYEIGFEINKYIENGNVQIQMMCLEDGWWGPFASMTVNLGIKCGEGCGSVDTNNVKGIEEWIDENELGEPTGRYGESGWCVYPEYRFDMDKIRENLVR